MQRLVACQLRAYGKLNTQYASRKEQRTRDANHKPPAAGQFFRGRIKSPARNGDYEFRTVRSTEESQISIRAWVSRFPSPTERAVSG
jgi:hypothetical protein